MSADVIGSGELERCARRVYELHRARDARRRRSHEDRTRTGSPKWDELPEPERSRLIATYWRARSSYEAGRRDPREVRIDDAPPVSHACRGA